MRGIPEEVRERVTRTARKLGVPVHEVVRAFLVHGLEDYEAGRLRLEPRPRTVRWTLFPP